MRFTLSILFFLSLGLISLCAEGDGMFTLTKPALNQMAELPVHHGGRVMPLDSWARQLLLQFSAKSSVDKKTATEWGTGLFFNPKLRDSENIFQVNHREVLLALGLEEDKKRRYSFDYLKKGFSKLDGLTSSAAKIPNKEQSPVEREILKLNHNLSSYYELRQFGSSLEAIAENGEHLHLSFPDVFRLNQTKTHEMTDLFVSLKKNWSAGNQKGFDKKLDTLFLLMNKDLDAPTLSKCKWEVSMNRLAPFYRAELLYGFAMLLGLFSAFGWRKWLMRSACALMIAGFLLQTVGILGRMWIMSRPPVTNLYSTFIFVGWTCVLMGIVIYYSKDKLIGVVSGGISGLVFLMIGDKYAIEGDTMGVMVAVLNSNFWLATHVVTISLGYAGCCLAGLLAHIYLIRLLPRKPDKAALVRTYRIMLATLGFGLALTFIGTILGGVWADQSWGRFWGWDPKENGALLIILWCSLVIHARLAGMIKEVGMAIGTIFGIQIVLLAWFGVNLLGVGLHSYGFTTGVANSLVIFLLFEIIFVICVRLFKLSKV